MNPSPLTLIPHPTTLSPKPSPLIPHPLAPSTPQPLAPSHPHTLTPPHTPQPLNPSTPQPLNPQPYHPIPLPLPPPPPLKVLSAFTDGLTRVSERVKALGEGGAQAAPPELARIRQQLIMVVWAVARAWQAGALEAIGLEPRQVGGVGCSLAVA